MDRPRSSVVTEGSQRAPQRAFFRAMGLKDEDIHRPWVGVAHTWNEATPCNLTLDRQAKAASEGVKAAGGTPREFVTIAVSDGIAMGHEGMKASLISREIIADSVELMMHAHGYDALVGVAGCDKSLPGMLMAMGRLNVPSIFLYGGTILPGRFKGKDVTMRICTRWNAMPARRREVAADNSRPTRWHALPRRSAWRCPAAARRRRWIRPAMRSRCSAAGR
jgi:dihydroxyacid dehydratase/phosphogluconate dehydratase